ncbi:hypothetical protein [Hymenobacter sp. BT491]|uniref:hypothetical protein n=1 Tax=Hymenobacter sp. BT491 TaxID=2766779 RepID=UPI001653EBD6|nr:hypothetical protein [Hymenobacter sp. BT491]MBC6988343.1 hypothetical protein [Hymenobacter sp. BT491]
MKILFLLLFISSNPAASAGALPPYTIQVSAHSAASGRRFDITMRRERRTVTLIYQKQEGVNQAQLRADPLYGKLARQLQPSLPRDSIKALSDALEVVIEKHSYFTKDSLLLPVARNKALVALLDSAYLASPETLENPEANRSRIVLDGTGFRFSFLAEGKTVKQAYVRAPSPHTHALLYRLITVPLSLYRSKHPNSFLDEATTSGY